MRKRKIFNFLVMWIEIDVIIPKFIKQNEISVNIRNFTKQIENCEYSKFYKVD